MLKDRSYLGRLLEKPLLKRWHDIDHAITIILDEIGEIPPDGPSALEDIDPINDTLGCGGYGCVFPLNTERFVLKVTTDPQEGPITAFIIENNDLRFHPGVAFFLAIWELYEKTYKDNSIYIILRETVKPYQGQNKKITDIINLSYKKSIRLAEAKKEFNKTEDWSSFKKYRLLKKEWELSLKKMYNILPTKYIAEFIKLCSKKELFLEDVYDENIGKRIFDLGDIIEDAAIPNDYLSIFDVGASDIKEEPIITKLPPEWEENPRIPIL
jgi:hypothetical protein